MLILRENVHLLWALLSCIGISFFSALFISECKITGFILPVCEGRLAFMPERSFPYVRKIQFSAGSIQGDRPDRGQGTDPVWRFQYPYRGDIPHQRRPILLSDGQKMAPKPITWGFPASRTRGASSMPEVIQRWINRCSAVLSWSEDVSYQQPESICGTGKRISTTSVFRGRKGFTWPDYGTTFKGRSGL